MSRSHSYSSSHSRGNRPQRSANISVTEASFQNLQLGETATNQHAAIPSAYSTSGHSYPRTSYSQGDPTTTYLSAGYDSTDFASVSPSGSFLDSQRAISPAFLDQDPVYFAADPSDFRADMSSYNYARNTTVPSSYDSQGSYPSSRSSSIPGYSYSRDASHRSTSYPFGPHILPSSVPGSLSMDDREAARQRRRRQLHLSRRQSKARVRRTRLPSIPDAEPSLEENVDHLVDFPTAPSTSSSYDIPGSSQYSRTTSTSAPYLTSTSPNPYVNYTPGYVGNISPQPSYPSDPHIRPSAGMSGTGSYRAGRTAGHSVSPNPEESIRVVESPRRPQCWEHGCNGRQFSTFSNLLRHQREKSGTAAKSYCPRCGAEFTRTTARNGHMAHEKCKPRQQD